MGSIPDSGRFPGEGNDNPLQYSCLGNPMDRGTWWATVSGVTSSWTLLTWTTTTINSPSTLQFKNHTAHHVRRHAVSRHSYHLLIYFLVLHLKAGCFFFFTKSNKRQIYIKDGKETQLIWDLTCSSDKVIIAKNATLASFLYFVSLKTAKGFQVYWHLLLSTLYCFG